MTPTEWRERLVFEIGDDHAFPSERRYLAALLREWDAHEPDRHFGDNLHYCNECHPGEEDQWAFLGKDGLCPARRRMMGEKA